ncbi:hypothetical protein E2C01_097934 [Portunus trituberculatus]|uniref:Uncharacterized protein n=1 Tax=Portunus trituberculatus TaxID=210409 RepID=A0A5B7K663_PORTR|nr:hypothetical protein [Portunus trituberculatus]
MLFLTRLMTPLGDRRSALGWFLWRRVIGTGGLTEQMFVDGQVGEAMPGNRLGGCRTPVCIAFYWRKKLDPVHSV